MAASAAHFPASGTVPPDLFFSVPQYNTWIELIYNQNQEDILKYAHSIVDNGFPTGILMIDDNWQKYYGNFEFRPDRFPDPKGMIDELHTLGFKVMLWVCPFVSPDSQEFRWLREKGYLVKTADGLRPAILDWWNGLSACYDLSNPEAFEYYRSILVQMQEEFGVDGFKFDAGDPERYQAKDIMPYDGKSFDTEQTELWAKLGLLFPYNEFRACWKMGGEALVQRLGDKEYSWDGVVRLVPSMIAAGLLGHPYTCPDMIGGGQFGSFLNIDQDKFDQSLIVRSCQIHSMMPMMQFSVAPWRVLSAENLEIVKEMAILHAKFAPYIMQYAHHAAKTGEPIVRCMEYQYPHHGMEMIKDQFMLGDKYLVAPMTTPGTERTVVLPKGTWCDEQGKRYRGGKTYTISVPLARLPYFELIK
jgi:alpha-glucosidase